FSWRNLILKSDISLVGIRISTRDKTSGGCMKSITAKITSLMVAVLLCAAMGYAQYGSHVILKVDVPFEFNVGKRVLPAGSYQVVQVAPQMLALRDDNNSLLASITTTPVVARNARYTPVLKFAVDGERHVLSQVWTGNGNATGYELALPKRVTYLAQQ